MSGLHPRLTKKEAEVVLIILDEAENMLHFECLSKKDRDALASARKKLRQEASGQ